MRPFHGSAHPVARLRNRSSYFRLKAPILMMKVTGLLQVAPPPVFP